MKNAKKRFSCRDCDLELRWIQVYDLGQGTGPYGGHKGLVYTAFNASPSFWSGVRAVTEGVLQAATCPDCCRVTWFAMSEDEWREIQNSHKSKEAGAKPLKQEALPHHQKGEAEDRTDSLKTNSMSCLQCNASMLEEQDTCPSCGWTFKF